MVRLVQSNNPNVFFAKTSNFLVFRLPFPQLFHSPGQCVVQALRAGAQRHGFPGVVAHELLPARLAHLLRVGRHLAMNDLTTDLNTEYNLMSKTEFLPGPRCVEWLSGADRIVAQHDEDRAPPPRASRTRCGRVSAADLNTEHKK